MTSSSHKKCRIKDSSEPLAVSKDSSGGAASSHQKKAVSNTQLGLGRLLRLLRLLRINPITATFVVFQLRQGGHGRIRRRRRILRGNRNDKLLLSNKEAPPHKVLRYLAPPLLFIVGAFKFVAERSVGICCCWDMARYQQHAICGT
jgi:hypothetical protein